MSGKHALSAFLAVCIILAALLLTGVVTVIVGSCVFAVALLTLGGVSGAFRKRRPK